VKNLNDAIDRAENRTLILCKFYHFCSHENNPNIDLSDKDQESLDRLKLLDFMEKVKSKSPTRPSNPTESFTNYIKHIAEISSIEIDRS
jgi:hypothetical protein